MRLIDEAPAIAAKAIERGWVKPCDPNQIVSHKTYQQIQRLKNKLNGLTTHGLKPKRIISNSPKAIYNRERMRMKRQQRLAST